MGGGDYGSRHFGAWIIEHANISAPKFPRQADPDPLVKARPRVTSGGFGRRSGGAGEGGTPTRQCPVRLLSPALWRPVGIFEWRGAALRRAGRGISPVSSEVGPGGSSVRRRGRSVRPAGGRRAGRATQAGPRSSRPGGARVGEGDSRNDRSRQSSASEGPPEDGMHGRPSLQLELPRRTQSVTPSPEHECR